MADATTEATPEKIEDDFQATEDIDTNLEADYDRIQAGEPRSEESDDEKNEESQDTKKEDESTQADDKKEPGDDTQEHGKGDKADKEESKGEDEPATVTAPDSWTTDAKAKFKDVDPLIQKEILKREEDFQNGHVKSEDARQLAKEFKETVSPYEAIILSEGGTPMGAFKDLLNMGFVLRQGTPEQKTQLLLNTAKRFNVDLGTVKQGTEDEYIDPQIADLNAKISSLQTQNDTKLATEQQGRNTEALRLIDEFKDAKDDKGNLVNPHYEAAREIMGVLINSGQVSTIKDAYERAIWSNPKVRDEMLKAQKTEVDKTKLEETKKKAAAAKKAAGTHVSTDQTDVAPDSLSEDEALNAKYDEIFSR